MDVLVVVKEKVARFIIFNGGHMSSILKESSLTGVYLLV